VRPIRSKKLWLVIGLPLFLVGTIVILLVVVPTSPLSPLHMCTLIGCQDALELTFSREPPGQYSVQLTTSTGETRSVSCTNGEFSSADDTSYICKTGIISIYNFTPASVTVEIRWQGGSYTTSGQPTYTSFQPNGPSCPPTCRVGKMLVELP